MLYAIIAAVVLGVVALIVPSSIVRRKKFALADRQKFEALTLAADLVEIGKYLILYERAFFRKDPLALNVAGSGGVTRGQCVRGLWQSGYGFQATTDACGGMAPNGTYTGTNQLDCGGGISITYASSRRSVFCPSYLRSQLLTGRMVQEFLFERWAARGVVDKVRAGHYALEIDMTSALKGSLQNELSIRLNYGQKLLEDVDAGFFGGSNIEAKLKFEFLTDSAGFVSAAAERYIRITATLSFPGDKDTRHFVDKSTTMMISLSTPKDFALFMPYPDANTSAAALNAPTDKYSAAVNLSSDAIFAGRVYFNGDFDTEIDSLPLFQEAVVISGAVKGPDGKIPGPSQLDVLRKKFRKGIVTHFSAPRFVYDGACAKDDPASPELKISNGTRLFCKQPLDATKPYHIVDYIMGMPPVSACWNAELLAKNRTERALGSVMSPSSLVGSCLPGPRDSSSTFVTGGWRTIRGEGVAPIMSPVKEVKLATNTTVHGTLFAGNVSGSGKNVFIPLSALRVGAPGVFNEDALIDINAKSVGAYAGVTVPLLNMPVVMETGDEGG